MAPREVEPGDLITARDWNDLLAALGALDRRATDLVTAFAALDRRVTDLVTGFGGLDQRVTHLADALAALDRRVTDLESPPRISQVVPEGERTAGDVIRIYGSNFDFTRGGHSVKFGTTPVFNFLTGSSDSLLIVRIPDNVDGATATGALVVMTVANLRSSARWAIKVRSISETPTGSILFKYSPTESPTPKPNEPLTLTFNLESRTKATTVAITPTTRRQGGGSLIDDSKIEVRSNDVLVANRQIPLPEGGRKSVKITIPTIPNAPDVGFTVLVAASAPDLTTENCVIPDLVIGKTSTAPDPTVTAWQRNSEDVDNGTVTYEPVSDGIVSGQFKITRKDHSAAAKLTIEISATFSGIPAGGKYTYIVDQSVSVASQGWSVVRHPNTPAQYEISATSSQEFPIWELTTGSATGEAIVTLGVHRSADGVEQRTAIKYRVFVS